MGPVLVEQSLAGAKGGSKQQEIKLELDAGMNRVSQDGEKYCHSSSHKQELVWGIAPEGQSGELPWHKASREGRVACSWSLVERKMGIVAMGELGWVSSLPGTTGELP